MSRTVVPAEAQPFHVPGGTSIFLCGLALVVLFIALWSRVVARNVHTASLHRTLKRFHLSVAIARVFIPIWFGVGIFVLGWTGTVNRLLGPAARWPVDLPGMLLGTFPCFAAWMGLWWAQFPAERALREQNLLVLIEEELPIHAPPNLLAYFIANLRLQLLFTVVPVVLIILLHDIAAIAAWAYLRIDLRVPRGQIDSNIELLIQLTSIALVVFFAPEVLRRVLHTQPLPDTPLRRRLEQLCRRAGLRYRDILLWRTNNAMGNALVMGLIPQMRYILLSDMLLETMNDREIEAVFAHEIGHVKHWHLGWYVVLVVTLILMCFGPGQLLSDRIEQWPRPAWMTDDLLGAAGALAGVGAFFLIFGYLSRWFERQADVYAARMIEQNPSETAALVSIALESPVNLPSHVGPHGFKIFASALHRVAVINNIPLRERNFTHGSIAQRMHYLETLSTDPRHTARFDRAMSLLYGIMIACLLMCGLWVLLMQRI
jgi:STE24 endopeptidase